MWNYTRRWKNQAERNFVTNNDINLNDIYNQNNDLVGWLKIDDTNIDYPVMQTKNLVNYNWIHFNISISNRREVEVDMEKCKKRNTKHCTKSK